MSPTEYRHPRSPWRDCHCPGTVLECLLVPNPSLSLEVLASNFPFKPPFYYIHVSGGLKGSVSQGAVSMMRTRYSYKMNVKAQWDENLIHHTQKNDRCARFHLLTGISFFVVINKIVCYFNWALSDSFRYTDHGIVRSSEILANFLIIGKGILSKIVMEILKTNSIRN